MTEDSDPRSTFINASLWFGSLDLAEQIRAAHPEVSESDIYAAAILGDDAAVRRFLSADAGSATRKGGPRGWDALTYLCFSRYLRLDRSRSAAFVRAATALLDAGAGAETGYFDPTHEPEPTFESALYGAAGLAQHADLTRLLLERGADPNDDEVPYHAPETNDNAALLVLVESGKLNADSLSTMLLRKADWHDHEGMKCLLERGADPNRMTRWGYTALHQALRRDNALSNIKALLDHGADPAVVNSVDGRSAVSIAARRGRRDVLDLFEARGVPIEVRGVERLIAACARGDVAAARALTTSEPGLLRELLSEGGALLAEFAGTANVEGMRLLLDLGVPVGALHEQGDAYFDIARGSTALHVAAWRGWPEAVTLLIERGAEVTQVDGKGRTPLSLAVRACVDSYWTYRRSPDAVRALLEAGATVLGVAYPSGYAEVDDLLKAHGAACR